MRKLIPLLSLSLLLSGCTTYQSISDKRTEQPASPTNTQYSIIDQSKRPSGNLYDKYFDELMNPLIRGINGGPQPQIPPTLILPHK